MDADIATLSGFALGEVLSSLDLDPSSLSSVQSQLGLGSSSNKISKSSIYNDKFADDDDGDGLDDDEDLEDDREDYEAMIDREMREEMDKEAKKRKKLEKETGGKAKGKQLMRGEEDDFDEEDDEDEAMKDDTTTTTTRVKDEPKDDDDEDDLFGGSDSSSPPPAHQQPQSNVSQLPTQDPIQVENLAAPPAKQVDVKDLFPSFEYGKTLEFTDLFAMRPRKKRRVAKEGVKLALPSTTELSRPKSTRDSLLAPLRPLPPPAKGDELVRSMLLEARAESMREAGAAAGDEEESEGEELRKAVERAARRTKTSWRIPDDEEAFELAELDEWEDQIVWGPSHKPSRYPQQESVLAPRNPLFEQGDWIKSILWDGENPQRSEYFTRLNLNLNDTQMLLEVHEPKPELPPETVPVAPINALGSASMLAPRDATLDPFNLSNDAEYEVPKEHKKQAVRQTFGALEVVHAYPAQKLQLPFYKTRLSKSDTRSFHRPALQFPQNIPITFTKVKSRKKKDKNGVKIKKSDGAEGLRGMQDITLKDTSSFVLWEYSEEHPPVISNVGMGSIIVNYYRKKDPQDSFIPRLEIGQPLLLEGTDESPFKIFGFVEPGQTVTTLYNNLVRAPMFKHQPPETDFLVVR
ncbi:hypothetical protein JCM16303_007351, partial [Sporobolomyces ruberrimus]